MTSNKLQGFFDLARRYRYDPEFDLKERDYKLRLAADFGRAREAMRSGSPQGLNLFRAAVRSPDDNIIHWRQQQPLLKWCSDDWPSVRAALLGLWEGKAPLPDRFSTFAATLPAGGLSQPGAQLTVTSTFLMALSPFDHPPIRIQPFDRAFQQAGFPRFPPAHLPVGRYLHALAFLDFLLHEAPNFNVELRDRLDAQGVVWCVGGGWRSAPRLPNPLASLATHPEPESDIEALEIVAQDPEATALTDTERRALVLARRGQGRFRDRLLALWGGCAVTACREPRLLRASHLKPWRVSTNAERLNPYNGLLLTPNLDSALDRGLVSFTDDGKIVISVRLSAADRRAIGLESSMRLRGLNEQHVPFLRYHRTSVLEKVHP